MDGTGTDAQAPAELRQLLGATSAEGRAEAWTHFQEKYRDRILFHCRRELHWQDGPEDGFVWILERLSENEFAKLRRYTPQRDCTFPTWLGTVCQRLAIDCRRHRYGRLDRGKDGNEADAMRLAEREEDRIARAKLVDLIASSLQTVDLPEDSGGGVMEVMIHREKLLALSACIDHLPPRDRLLVTTRFVGGKTASEIAGLMQYPTQWHVFRAIKAALAQLKACLGKWGVGSP